MRIGVKRSFVAGLAILAIVSSSVSVEAQDKTDEGPFSAGDGSLEPTTTLPPPSEVIGIAQREVESGRRDILVSSPAPIGLDETNKALLENLALVRSEMGLDPAESLVKSLMVEERAGGDLRDYGTVLTADERQYFDLLRRQDKAVDVLLGSVSLIAGYAGGAWGLNKDGEREKIVLWSNGEGFREIEAIVAANNVEGIPVIVVERNSSWAELRSASANLNNAILAKDSKVLESLVGVGLSELFPDGIAQLTGYSIADNELLIATSNPKLVRLGSQTSQSKLSYRFRPLTNDIGTSGSPCNKVGCSAARAGIEIERSGSSAYCTLGFAVVDGSNEDFHTAEHCGPTTAFSWDLQARHFPSLTRGFDLRLGSFNSSPNDPHP